ncbi:MAG: HlyD family efflux transporter periplasmic adaptor subunit, partial [Planctomycetota bacterium]
EIERVGMVLRSPVSGQVHLVSATAGRSIILGQEILAITPTVGKSVVFYQPALNDGRLAVGDQMEVRLPGQARILNALIEVMSPVIEEIPAALWRDPAVPEYGRAARLSPMPELELVPGAPVQVSISER